MDLEPATRELGLRLSLGDLNHRNPCSGYACGCVCSECQARSKNVSPAFRRWLEDRGTASMPRLFQPPKRVALPWELDQAA